MKIAIPLFQNRVSPRFEFAPALLVATVRDNQVVEKKQLDISAYEYDPFHRSSLLRKLEVDVLICGGLEDFTVRLLNGKKVAVIPSISGDANEALQRYLQGSLSPFPGPCCGRGKRKRCGGGSL